jgi:hypothetical protein
MKNVLWRSLAVLGSVSVLLGIFPMHVNAQNKVANGFRVSPVRSEYTIEKGKNQTMSITVENLTDLATVAKPIVNDFVASDKEDGEPLLILDDKATAPKNSFKSLVGPIGDISLGPKQKKDVTVNIAVPSGANSGGYYGAIRFAPTITGDQSNVGLTASVGTIVLITVPGNLVEKLDLLSLSAGQGDKAKSFFTAGDVSVITRLKNTGDIHVKPFGKVQVKDMFGRTVKAYEFNATDPRANILPGSTRKFVDALPKRAWFGRYTISANLGFSQGSGDLIAAKATFWYMPIWAIVILVLLLLVIIVAVIFLIRFFRSSGGNKRFSRRKR